jgi:histidinol-phosphatase
MADITARMQLALEAGREAGRITLDFFRRDDLQVDRKSDDSPVTAADRQAEELLRRRIAAAFPQDAILGEEFPERAGSSSYRWIIDPIDGTKSFVHGVPLYGTLIGLEREGRSIMGVIHIPALDETVYAAEGHGAWYQLGDRPRVAAKVSDRSLAQGLFLTSEVGSFTKIGKRAVYDRLEAAARLARSWGDCYGYLMVATGRAEVMIDPIVSVWDLAALQPIIEQAGGTFTDWQGRPTIHSGQAIAANARVYDDVLAIVQNG